MIRLPRYDVPQLNRPLRTPRHEALGEKSRAIVEPNRLRLASPGHHLLQHVDHPFGGERCIDLNRQDFPHAFIQNVECSKSLPVPYRVLRMKSNAEMAFGCGSTTRGYAGLVSRRCLVRRSWSAYFQNPQRGQVTPRVVSSSITGASSRAQMTTGRSYVVRLSPTA